MLRDFIITWSKPQNSRKGDEGGVLSAKHKQSAAGERMSFLRVGEIADIPE